jgi:hypothetical protein
MQDIYLVILSVLLGGAIGAVAWAFKSINKIDKGLAVNNSQVATIDLRTSTLEVLRSSQNDRLVRLETKQEVTDDKMGDMKMDIKEIVEEFRTGNKDQAEFNTEVMRKLDRVLDSKGDSL